MALMLPPGEAAAAPAGARLALFDLDHTLVPFDTGMAWTRWWAAQGITPPDHPARYLAVCQGLVDGRADLHDVHRALVDPVREHGAAAWAAWAPGFLAAVTPQVPEAMRELVERHRRAGDRCALVTATAERAAAPLAAWFGLPTLIGTRSAPAAGADRDGPLSGGIDGRPCHGDAKPQRVAAWLASLGLGPAALARSVAYSDAVSDLPLLESVSEPVAVRPDARLRAVATARGWTVLGTR